LIRRRKGWQRFLLLALGVFVVAGACTRAPRGQARTVAPSAPPPRVVRKPVEPQPSPVPASLPPEKSGLSDDVGATPAEERLRMLALELAANRDGSTEPPVDRAVIDDLRGIEPAVPSDPKLKESAQKDVREAVHDLPIELNNRVLALLEYYQNGRGRSTIAVGLERAGRYRPMIERILAEEEVPLDLIYLCQAESAFLPRALSRAKAKGLWQFISSRGKEYGLRQNWWIDERSDPEKSTRAAARHLKDLYEQFGDWYLAMAAYNAGPARVTRALNRTGAKTFWALADKRALPRETINYVPTVLALAIIGKNPEKYGFTITPAAPVETERVFVDKATDLRVIADAIGVPVDELRDLNSHLLRWTTPPDDPEFELILPKGKQDLFEQEVASLPENRRLLFREHPVRRGETLSAIARKYGASVSDLARANKLNVRKPLQIGQTLLIPLSGVAPATATPKTILAAARPSTYTVRRGDTLTKIADRFDVTVNNLKRWNNLTSAHLVVGQQLLVSAPPMASLDQRKVLHEVRRGETLFKIASAYKTTVDAILSWNNENDLTILRPGEQLTIFVSAED